MTTLAGMQMAFRNMQRAAQNVGFPLYAFELSPGNPSRGIGHKILGPTPERVQPLGQNFYAATLIIEGMTRAFTLMAERTPAPATAEEAAVLAAEIDPHVVRLGDHFEADEAK